MSLSKPANLVLLAKESSLGLYEFLKTLKLNRTGYSTKVVVAGSVALLVVTST